MKEKCLKYKISTIQLKREQKIKKENHKNQN